MLQSFDKIKKSEHRIVRLNRLERIARLLQYNKPMILQQPLLLS
jgi:hypothetical protein